MFKYDVFDVKNFVGRATTYEDATQEWIEDNYEIYYEERKDFRIYEKC